MYLYVMNQSGTEDTISGRLITYLTLGTYCPYCLLATALPPTYTLVPYSETEKYM